MTDVSTILDERLPQEQLALLRSMAGASADMGAELYLVGGTVRDMLSGRTPSDLDLTAAGAAPDLPDLLARQLGGEVYARSRFGTAKLRFGGAEMDLAASRRETYAHPGALPEVEPAGIDEDLARRDFSVNAAAVCLAAEHWGELLDPFDGRGDLGRGVIRVLHDGSFVDDSTRIIRAVRYAGRMGFRMEHKTGLLLGAGLPYLDGISGDRLRHELERTLAEDRAVPILSEAQKLGVLAAVHPALSVGPALVESSLGAPVGRRPRARLWLLAALVSSADGAALSSVVRRLNMDSNWARVVRDVEGVRRAFPRLLAPGVRPSQVHAALRHLDPAAIEGCASAAEDPRVVRALAHHLDELRDARPLLDGNDVMALGVPEGIQVGAALDRLLRARLDGELSTREDEERLVRRGLADAAT